MFPFSFFLFIVRKWIATTIHVTQMTVACFFFFVYLFNFNRSLYCYRITQYSLIINYTAIRQARCDLAVSRCQELFEMHLIRTETDVNAKKLRRCSGESLLQLLKFRSFRGILKSQFFPIAHPKTRSNKMSPPTLLSKRYYIERDIKTSIRALVTRIIKQSETLGTLPTTIIGNKILL